MAAEASGKKNKNIGTGYASDDSQRSGASISNETIGNDAQEVQKVDFSHKEVLSSRKTEESHIRMPHNLENGRHAESEDEQDPYGHLPPHQANILKRQVVTPKVQQGIKVIYCYITRNDAIIIGISSIFAVASGATMPLMNIVFGQLQNSFQGYSNDRDGAQPLTYSDFTNQITKFVLYFIYLAIAKIREHYLASCLRQNIAFFDNLGAGEVTTRITAETSLIQDGISEKVSLTIAAVATFITAYVVGFIMYWKLTLILSCCLFALFLTTSIGSSFMLKNNKVSLDAYAQGGSLAEEVISSIRNAIAFGTQDRLARKYGEYLDKGAKYGYKMQKSMAFMSATMWLILYLTYGLAFWQGSSYVLDEVIPLSKLLIVVFSIIVGSFSLVNVMPHIQAFTTAIAAVGNIANTINRPSPIDPMKDEGEKLDHVKGNLYFKNVQHIYPSRPEMIVMENVSLKIPAGKVTALVGASGSGKSTFIGLIERFYEPVGGTIYLDGHNISQLNLRWLRQQVALVSQEPTLFSTSIYQNIRYGLIGTKFEYETKQKQRQLIIEASKKANVHEFVMRLPEGYETNVGEKGFLLSGGQKQRIAIARAIVSDPKILLLDEATSALDTKSESAVQAALEVAAAGRTTIIIAHRLSTIKDAHNIVVMSHGRIIEQGTHVELINSKGHYFDLVSAQDILGTDALTIDTQEQQLGEKEQRLIRDIPTDFGGDIKMHHVESPTTEASQKADSNHEIGKGYSLWTLIALIKSFNDPEWKIMITGIVFSIICGATYPVMSVFFAKEISTLSHPINDQNRAALKRSSDFWSAMLLMIAVVQFIAYALQGAAFGFCSEKLIRRVRERAFRTILRQDVAFFDKDENTSGSLTAFLSTETTHVAGLSGVTLGTLTMMMATLIIGVVMSLAVGWKLSLVCLSATPVLLACGFYRFWILAQFQQRSKAEYAASASFASEAVSSIRTVASLTREVGVLNEYKEALRAQRRRSLVSVIKSSVLYAASQSLIFLCLALGFWYGGTLIGKGDYNEFQFFLCLTTVIFGSQSAGTIFSFAPNMSNAHRAATELKTLFDRQPTIDTWSAEGERLEKVEGKIEFRQVYLRYPERPEQLVLRGLNLYIQPGQYIALVGSSGCGKSTAISLLERFYDPTAGEVYIDGKDISTLNIADYRSFISLVSQEPTLYQGTIKDNITLGSACSDVSDEAVEFACREANIYDFIISLPDGFNTVVGSKGVLLSGGQKQRIAIARALIRDPKILLLDEATSALDSESERLVQAALDNAAKGRTTIAVAHRLSTIQRADRIYVFDMGRVIEEGTHADLMKKNGRYSELVNLQSLTNDA
ncbi:ABC transporter transmembrane region domain-containing protein [Trichoderma breve]|uniref:ABC transporter transmembrane region domain-containing protein n=1 Tax=Trichoderma breve TaxID=2034170 RepID=A0A9W9BGZ6_9HYPO|nr:ABC transporter transmembrane region domain-containing protein [Trichoderma breve]KAJ4859708.1 ABC transporter transmembrane region domain-containing protein [Trichoderma breve]